MRWLWTCGVFGLVGCPTAADILDRDGDGYEAGPQDCDDNNPDVYRGAPEICGNGVDDDCDGVPDRDEVGEGGKVFYEDHDRDGYGNEAQTTSACEVAPFGYVSVAGDCDDTNPNRAPNKGDTTCDGIDDDCDDEIDEDATEQPHYLDGDGDGFGAGAPTRTCDPEDGWVLDNGDCNDADPAIFPGASESCNGIDDNCAGGIDEGLLGDGPACAADDCQHIYSTYGDSGEGRFWLSGDDGTFEAECDIDGTHGGGWMKVDLDVMKDEGWVAFEKSSGTLAKWADGGERYIELDPGGITRCSVSPTYVRAELYVPISFTEVRGSWTFEPYRPSSLPHSGTDNILAAFGDPPRCRSDSFYTAVLFGNLNVMLKKGGSTGGSWSKTSSGDPDPAYTFQVGGSPTAKATLPETHELWWEIGGNQRDSYVGAELRVVNLYVR